MKRLSLILMVAAGLGMASCEKVKQVADFNNLGIGSYLTKVRVVNDQLNFSDLNNTSVSIVVAEKGSPVEKVTIYVTEGASKVKDRTKWKKVKEVPYSGETTLTTKATEIAAALGIPVTGLKPGQTYMLYNQITTKDGKVFDIANTGGDFEAISNYNMALTFPAIIVCPFVPTGFPGQFIVEEDGWGDYVAGEEITVNSATANSIAMTFYPSDYYGAQNRKAITVDIVPATGSASVKTQVYGDYSQFGLLGMTVTSTGTSNWVFSCSGSISLLLTHSQGQGTYRFRVRKK
jgi:hypothetical protein